jgi:hypothetical protein
MNFEGSNLTMTIRALYHVEPSVDGGFGERTQLVKGDGNFGDELSRTDVSVLAHQFQGWSGDEIVTSFPCYLITQRLLDDLLRTGLTGISHESAIIAVSDEPFTSLTAIEEQRFVWLKPTGKIDHIPKSLKQSQDPIKWAGHDFSLTPNAQLVLTERAINAIGYARIRHSIIRAFPVVTVTP